MDFFEHLFDTSGFPARWHCGLWTPAHGWLHIISDLCIWSAYFAIPIVLAFFVLRRRDLPFRWVFVLFVAFILLCGATHLMEAIIFWWPAYRLAGVIKLITAVVSWITVFALIRVAPSVLAMRSPEELNREIVARLDAERRLQDANTELERRVTERTRELTETVAALRSERELLSTTLASIGDGVIVTDTTGEVTFLNPVAEKMTGWNSSEARGLPLTRVFNIVNDRGGAPAENPALKALERGAVIGLANHTVLLSKDGHSRPIDDTAAPIRGESGVTGAVLVFRDVSERRAAEEANERVLATLESLTEGFWRLDRDWRLLHVNGAACQSFGMKRSDVIGKTLWDAFPAVRGSEVESQYQRAAAERVTVDFEHFYEPLGRWFGIKAFPTEDGGLGVLTRDVSERRRVEQQLHDLAQRLTKLVDNTPLAVVEWNAEFRITRWSGQAEKVFGWRHADVVGRSLNEFPLVFEHDWPRVRAAIDLMHDPRHPCVVSRNRNNTKSGRVVTCEWYNSVLHDKSGRIMAVLSLVLDVTEREQAEQALKEADRRKDEFLATLAHELRNPLAPIRNAVQLLRMIDPNGPHLQQLRDLIERQVAHLVRLVDDLLEVSRITRGKIELKRELVDLSAVVQNAVETSAPLIESGKHELTLAIPREPVEVEGDGVRLSQVVTNILNNAAKYTPEGGHIWMTLERADQEAIVRVRDNGVGIPAEMLDSVFDLFTQVKMPNRPAQGGLGIGLALVKRLVEMHGGRVEVHSEGPGRGSEFILRLPRAETSSMGSDEKAPAAQEHNFPPCRIVVVDDNVDAADSLSLLLSFYGHEVSTAYDGLSGIQQIETFQPEVVFLDLGMPGLSGFEVAKQVRKLQRRERVKLVALTGWGQERDRRQTQEAGFDGHLVKPVAPAALQELLASVRAV